MNLGDDLFVGCIYVGKDFKIQIGSKEDHEPNVRHAAVAFAITHEKATPPEKSWVN